MKTQSNNPAAAWTAKITDLVENLAKETDQARISETLQTWLKTCAKFYQSSPISPNLAQIPTSKPPTRN
jgi:glutamate synthase domain-containing protein 3